jgi:N-acetylglucosamine-6-phosphate deacetylase
MSTARVENGKRSAGLMEIGLTDDRLTLELLSDNHHIIPELLKMAYKMKGADKLVLVSDCLRAGGQPKDGRVYTLGRENDAEATKFIVDLGVARLLDGTRFAGSITPLGVMIKNVTGIGVPLVDAVKMASITPARVIGVDKLYGSVAEGKKADIYIADEKLNPEITIVNGIRRNG